MIVADDDCSVNSIVCCLEEMPCASILLNDWTRLARNLNASQINVEKWRHELLLNKKQIWDVMAALLVDWRNRLGNDAKFETLLDIVGKRCGWTDIAEHLWKNLFKVTELTQWKDLDTRARDKIMAAKVDILGQQTTFGTIFNNLDGKPDDALISKLLPGPLISKLFTGHVVLTRDVLPEEPKYYIPRTLSTKRIINPKVFGKPCSDIFVIKNIGLAHLSQLAGKEQIDKSHPQIHNITARFISLAFPEDFDTICEIAKDCSVHLLNHDDNVLYWLKSHGRINTIQDYLSEEERKYSETEILSGEGFYGLEDKRLCIVDTPGMGKSELLASLCRNRRRTLPERITIFAVFSDLLAKVEHHTKMDREIAMSMITSYVSANDVGGELLVQILTSKTNQSEIFFDGFDEIPFEKVQMAMDFLKCLAREFPNVRLCISSRPYRKRQLEQTLGTLSYNIVPFTSMDQTNFLQSYWLEKYGIQTNSSLKQFSSRLVSSVASTVSSKEREVAGVPLQCAILAEIYQKDARKHANASNVTPDIYLSACSITDLFKTLMMMRFEKVEKTRQKQVKHVHRMTALKLLFPAFYDDFNLIFGSLEVTDISSEEINSIGIMEYQTLTEDDHECKFRFAHRTYAEFLVSESIVEKLENLEQLDVYARYRLDYVLYAEILKSVSMDSDITVGSIGCNILAILREMKTSPTIVECRNKWAALASQLNIASCNILEIKAALRRFQLQNNGMEESRDPLGFLLYYWTKKKTTQPRLAELTDALNDLNFREISDILKSKYYVPGFAHQNICFFLNSLLAGATGDDTTVSFSYVESASPDQCDDEINLLTRALKVSATLDFEHLFKLVSSSCIAVKISLQRKLRDHDFVDLLCRACRHSSLNLISECCNLIEQVKDQTLDQLEFSRISDSPIRTPLQIASDRGEFAIFDFMYKKLENRTHDFKNLLYLCVNSSMLNSPKTIEDKLEIVRILLNSNNMTLLEEEHPLRFPTPILLPSVHIKLLEFLISEGADISKVNRHAGWNVGHMVASNQSPESFHSFTCFLLENGHEDIFKMGDKKKRTPLHVALLSCEVKPETVQLLSSNLGNCFNNPNCDGDTELFLAIIGYRSIELIKLIIELGGDPKRLRRNGQTIVHLAAYYGNPDALDYFLSLHYDENARDKSQSTPLHLAARFAMMNVDSVIHLLIQNKADVNAVDGQGRTPLWYAEKDERNLILDPSTVYLLRSDPQKGT